MTNALLGMMNQSEAIKMTPWEAAVRSASGCHVLRLRNNAEDKLLTQVLPLLAFVRVVSSSLVL